MSGIDMIRAYHIVLGAYGFSLPNDPRDSWSLYMQSLDLLRHGEARNAGSPRALAVRPHGRSARLAAKELLRYSPVRFTGQQAQGIGKGFCCAIAESGYVIYACSILPQHAHVVLARHPIKVEQVVGHLKQRATQQLLLENLHPQSKARGRDGTPPSPWARKSWPVLLKSDQEILQAIRYVVQNPAQEGRPRQRWDFVAPFTG